MRRLSAWYQAAWKNSTAVCALLHAAIPAGFYAIWIVGLNPNRSYFFSEYTLKFVPFLRDARFLGWFDAWAMGDPRPRPVAVLATVMNLRLREEWSNWAVLPPSLGISWLLYPLTLLFLYKALRRMRFDAATGGAACLLWGLSPPALDSLVLCYVPAKALMNFWFAWGLGNAAILDIGGTKASRAAVRLAIALSLAWLTDETASIVMLVLLVAFAPSFWNPRRGRQAIARAWLSVTAPVILFAVVALVVYPLVNRLAGQVPLDFPQTVVRGPSVAYQSTAAHPEATKMVSSHFTGMWAKLDPLGMAFTMLTAHLLPNREVPGFWTWSRPRGPSDWPLDEAGAVCFFIAATIAAGARLLPEQRQTAVRIAASIAVLILAYTILLVPLAPAILEVNYYGGLFSMPFDMLLAIILFGPGCELGKRALIA